MTSEGGRRTSIDPAPRSYAASVSLLRRSARGSASAPPQQSMAAIEAWLLGAAAREGDLLLLFEDLCWRLAGALPLDRASIHLGTLHPQMVGLACNWERADGLCDEVKVPAAAQQSAAFEKNPLFRSIRLGELVRVNPQDAEAAARYPIAADLAKRGITDYATIPLGGAEHHNVATIATRSSGGFSEADYAALIRALRLFALHVERHIALRIAANVAETYLGADAGRKVLAGSIQRGSGEAIDAVIWSSDLRGFTTLSDRLTPADMIALLNAYFECMAGAVLAEGGEVLKFIGDGLLAAFPLSRSYAAGSAAKAAVAAAKDALARLDALNEAPAGPLAGAEGWRPLKTGVGLHEGVVFFGNVGAPERLDFTVIGAAVNAAARVEALTKALQRPVLLTAPVAAQLDGEALEDMGAHELRGLAEPVRLYALGAFATQL